MRFSPWDIDTSALANISILTMAAETDDELGSVLRFHLATESILSFYISEKTQGEISKYVKEPRDFGTKLSIATALGLPLPLARVIHQINAIRNKLAHKPDTSINDGDLKEMARCVNKLSEIDVNFVPLEKLYIELPVKFPNQKISFGTNGNRIDFMLAGLAFYRSAVQWVVQDAAFRRAADIAKELRP
ncbi:hypothetical protein N7650_09210 [Pseudomonas sp. GD04058]|uniref:hypothetical protein n=1 Tax=Pseudomonas sp. GD04058 TaxID=2975429 RepID=UPI00244D0D20|nr:hypothetical protein [Pseudomonas sp. GD04058]MDG9883011.1 hypothetical protein [Pseudomonas sp. GD04058]